MNFYLKIRCFYLSLILIQSSFFDLLPLEFYIHDLNLTESLNVLTLTDTLVDNLSFSSYNTVSVNLSVFNESIFLLTNNNLQQTETTTYSTFLEDNLNDLGLTESDFFGLFPSESLSNLEYSSTNDLNLVHTLPTDQLNDYTNLEAVKSQYHSSVPLRKLQYPEPFIASASFIHTDIGFIHVLQYNYWL
jgi:hypothetical protein